MILSPAVNLPFTLVRNLKFDEDATSGKPMTGILGVFLQHLVIRLLQTMTNLDQVARVFTRVVRVQDVREGMLIVVESLVKPRLPPKSKSPEIWARFEALRSPLRAG